MLWLWLISNPTPSNQAAHVLGLVAGLFVIIHSVISWNLSSIPLSWNALTVCFNPSEVIFPVLCPYWCYPLLCIFGRWALRLRYWAPESILVLPHWEPSVTLIIRKMNLGPGCIQVGYYLLTYPLLTNVLSLPSAPTTTLSLSQACLHPLKAIGISKNGFCGPLNWCTYN